MVQIDPQIGKGAINHKANIFVTNLLSKHSRLAGILPVSMFRKIKRLRIRPGPLSDCTTNATELLQNFWTLGDSSDSRDSFSASSDESSTYSLPPTPPATPPDSSQLWPGEEVVENKKRPSSAVGRFACDFCSKVFGDRAHLQEHQRYRHSD